MFLQYLNNYIFTFFPGLYIIDLMISIEDVVHHIIQVLYLFFYPSLKMKYLAEKNKFNWCKQ